MSSASLKAEQLQGELTSQQRSNETSMEALAIEHKCTKDNLQVHARTVLLALSYTLKLKQLPASSM